MYIGSFAAGEVEQGKLLKPVPEPEKKNVAAIEFNASSCAVLEKAGKVDVIIRRKGKLDCPATVRVETIDGTALAGEDYMELRQMVMFQPGETQRRVTVQVVDDNQWEPDETFFLGLSLPAAGDGAGVALGRKSVMEITIIDDDREWDGHPPRGLLAYTAMRTPSRKAIDVVSPEVDSFT
ncbi:sodium/calcium exchanger Calx-like [Dermacentor variabilis]|uniref:sodium/calcium exchanger Calx-like n=1 Tax=Dermacentor variabilis TaxID=34621 RepID=UPI003F5B3C30